MKNLTLYLLSCTVLLCNSACGSSNEQKEANPKIVALATVADERGAASQEFIGKVVPSKDLSLSFKVAGKVARTLVSQGSSVKAGQLLAELDDIDYRHQLDATEAEYQQIKAEVDRIVAMHGDGAVSDNNYDKAVYGMKQITAKYEQHKAELAYTRLYAPCAGKIKDVHVETGEIVAAGHPVVSMIDGGTPEIEIHVPHVDLAAINSNTVFSASFVSSPETLLPLRLLSVSPTANANQLYTVRLLLPVGATGIFPGMTAKVIMKATDVNGKSAPVMRIPAGAVDNNTVFRFNPDNSTVELVEVKIIRLLPCGDCIVASDALNIGETIVASGIHSLTDGISVTPLAPKSETNKGGLL